MNDGSGCLTERFNQAWWQGRDGGVQSRIQKQHGDSEKNPDNDMDTMFILAYLWFKDSL